MSGSLHGMKNVEQAMLLVACGRGEDWTLQQIRILQKDPDKEKETAEINNKD